MALVLQNKFLVMIAMPRSFSMVDVPGVQVVQVSQAQVVEVLAEGYSS